MEEALPTCKGLLFRVEFYRPRAVVETLGPHGFRADFHANTPELRNIPYTII